MPDPPPQTCQTPPKHARLPLPNTSACANSTLTPSASPAEERTQESWGAPSPLPSLPLTHKLCLPSPSWREARRSGHGEQEGTHQMPGCPRQVSRSKSMFGGSRVMLRDTWMTGRALQGSHGLAPQPHPVLQSPAHNAMPSARGSHLYRATVSASEPTSRSGYAFPSTSRPPDSE